MGMMTCVCGHRVVTRPEWAGKHVRCPSCNATLAVPEDDTAPAADEPVADGMKKCAYCQETIQSAAVKCRFCGEFVNRPRATPRVAAGRREDPGGVGVFVVALLGWLICGLLHPVAWAMGNSYESRCRDRGVEPNGMAKAGRIMGMIGTILILVGIGIVALILVAGGMSTVSIR